MARIAGLSDKLGLADACAEYARRLFGMVVSSGMLTGRTATHCTAASVLLACRKYGASSTIIDVARAAGLKKHDVYRAYEQICRRFKPDLPVQDPASYITRIGDKAGISEAARRMAREILASMDRSMTVGRDPMGLAAGAMYQACAMLGERVRRDDIAAAADMAASTLSTRRCEIARAMGASETRPW